MLAALASAFRIPDLRKKILFTAGLLAVYRIGSYIPVPGVNPAVMERLIEGGGVFGLMDMFAGGNLSRLTVFALNVGPYITASIVIQLLAMVVPQLEEMMKEGEEGRKRIQQYTRYGTIALALIQGTAYTLWGRSAGALVDPGFFSMSLIVIVMTAGTAFLMWLGEKISEHGIGNGISLIIYVGIVARIPEGARGLFSCWEAPVGSASQHGGVRLDRTRRRGGGSCDNAGREKNTGAVREAGSGQEDVRRTKPVPAAAREPCRCHSRDLRLFGVGVSGDHNQFCACASAGREIP